MNFHKYEDDIDKLVNEGELLYFSMLFDENPSAKEELKDTLVKLGKLPNFRSVYQSWYSEALEVVMQLLPSRVDDFTGYYKHQGSRKDLSHETYTIKDYLDRLVATRGYDKMLVVGTSSAITKFEQQLEIVKALKRRFVSCLFDIKSLAQADLFDNELDIASELNKNGFARAAGAVAGVVLESHLKSISGRHNVKLATKNPSIANYNDGLKDLGIIDISDWRKIQFLADIRNKCDHKKDVDPTRGDVEELIAGTRKYVKTLF